MKKWINGNGLRLIFAMLIALAFFLFLPITYFVSRNKARNLFMLEKNRKRNIKTVFLQKKQRKQRKKIVLKKISRPRLMKRNELRKRFKLDLSIAMGGAGSLVKVDARNIIYMENQVDVPPVRKRFFMPRYPIQARVENIETKVTAELLINEYGTVKRVRIIKCMPNWGFERAVNEALIQWQFEPAKIKNLPVKVWAVITIEFKL